MNWDEKDEKKLKAIEDRIRATRESDDSQSPASMAMSLVDLIDKLVDASQQHNDVISNAIRCKILEIKHRIRATCPQLTWADYDVISDEFHESLSDLRFQSILSEIEDAEYIAILLQRLTWLKSEEQVRPLTDSELSQRRTLPDDIEVCRQKMNRPEEW